MKKLLTVSLILSAVLWAQDSLNCRLIGNWPFGPSYAVALDPARSLAFCGSGGGVYLLNVSNPAQPVKLSEAIHTRGVVVEGLFYHNNRLFITAEEAGLEIWDVTDASNPSFSGRLNTPGLALGVTVSGNYAYVADHDSGLRIVDVSNPQSPTEVGYYDTPHRAYGVAVSGNYAYVADQDSGLRVIDVSNPQDPTEVGYYDTPGRALGEAGRA